jgi:lipopolysaccharide export system protein LptC
MFFENRITVFFLLLLAIVSSIEVYLLNTQGRKSTKGYGHYPDSIGYQLTLSRYDENGFLSNQITAQKAMHYPDTKTTVFTNAVLNIFNHQQDTPPWIAHAPSAVAYGRGERVDALGKVHMQREAFQDHPVMQIDTSDVTIFSDKKLLTTNAEVVGQQPGITVRGIGAKFDYEKNILDLLSQVQTVYIPKLANISDKKVVNK